MQILMVKLRHRKSILYPYAIKSLTNNTALINITHKFGHGVSYSILEVLDTENVFLQISQQQETGGVVLSEGCKNGDFSIIVADNIDRNEETLSGISYFNYFWLL